MAQQRVTEEKIEPVVKKLKVRLSPEAAFKLFTDGMHRWWPLTTHSVARENAASCRFEGWVGGRIVEVGKSGQEAEWGKVLVWDPFHTVSFQWYPERTPETAQVVTVTFSEFASGCLVELVHAGWETLGTGAMEKREGYAVGWDIVLGKYVELAGSQ
jgi:uncharacterized protein YndB with AHSA1/START domain